MNKIEGYYQFAGEHYLTLDGVKYAARLSFPHVHKDLFDCNYVDNILIPLIGTVRHHHYPEIQKYPAPEPLRVLRDLFGVALVSARLSATYQIEYKGDRPTVTDNSIETIFVPSMIINFTHFQSARAGKLATLIASTSKT
jgi:hypothetical protein